IELSLLQRCAAHCASGTDIAESFLSGKTAVEAAVSGQTDKMVGFTCTRDASGYHCEPTLFDLSLVANTEKKVPLEWINEEGNGVNQGFIDYCLPLVQGETGMVKEDGLPRFVKLKRVFAK
ncbi:MAG: 6-phosphofructokinase, partial [Faecousia sp.]